MKHPRSNKTMAVYYGSYTTVNHKVTVVNGLYFAHLIATISRPFFDARIQPKTVKNDWKIEYLVVYGTIKYDRNTVTIKRAKYGRL